MWWILWRKRLRILRRIRLASTCGMGLDYSQKRLVSAPLRSKRHDKQSERLKLYAFLTGLLSTIVSLFQLIITALK